jgi:hypothetical protein
MGPFDQARRILIRRRRTRVSGWPAAGDSRRRRSAAGLAGGTQSRVSGLGLRRGEHLRAARGTAKLPRAAVAEERIHTTAAWLGTAAKSGDNFYGRHGARGQQHVRRVASSPPCADPGQLLVGGEATTAGDCSDGGA